MKNNYLTLSQIGLYNPQRLSDEAVQDLFVVRKKLFEFLMQKIKTEQPNSIPQHYLIIAQRGMGKTTLLKRVEVELRKAENKTQFIPLLFPEEQYNLKNLAEFWLNSLDALADTLEFEKETEAVKLVDNKVRELEKIKNDEELAKEAFQFLKTFTQKVGRRPVLLIDNMSFIFDRLEKSEQHKLRAWLMENASPILLGASAVAIEDTYDYGAAFYDAFQIYYLQKLSFEELLEILTNLAKLTNSEHLIQSINHEKARIKTLYQLSDNSVRFAVILFKIIINGFSNNIIDDLESILEEFTPTFKAQFEELPTQMQIIVDAIALHWDPINIEQLRNETRYENNQLSPQLKRLYELGWIEKLDAFEAKGNAYQISNRFFNIWYIIRRSNRREKANVHVLALFLVNSFDENSISSDDSQVYLLNEFDFQEKESNSIRNIISELEKKNLGIAEKYLLLELKRNILNIEYESNWWRFGAVATKLGYGKWLTEILAEKGFDVILAPYYVALKAMNEKDQEAYLNSKAVEIREPARKLIELMKKY